MGPRCLEPPCHLQKIKTKFYINDELWNLAIKSSTDSINSYLSQQIGKIIFRINKNLARLDNGGYEIHFDRPAVKLNTSDVKMKEKYKDRHNLDKEKIFDNSNIYAHAFSFQEAVKKMKNRNQVDVR